MSTEKFIIYPKDIQRITGKSYQTSLNMMKKIKSSLKKKREHLLTIDEFCKYTGLKIEQVANKL